MQNVVDEQDICWTVFGIELFGNEVQLLPSNAKLLDVELTATHYVLVAHETALTNGAAAVVQSMRVPVGQSPPE